MKRSLKRGILAASVAAIGLASGTAMAENDVAAMREQVEAMKERVAKIEAERETKKRIAAAASVEAGSRPRSWKLPGTNTSMSIGGYVKADFIWDMNAPAGDKFSQDSDSLAVDNSVAARKQGQFRFHARSSRLFVRTDTPTDWGALVTYFEADFFGGSTSVSSQVNNGYFANSDFRLRHAYGQLGPVLAGQTTSLFLPSSYFGEIIDAGGPVGTNTNRRGQLRYTHVFPGGFSLAASIEDPGSPGRTVCATNSPSTICSAGLATNPVFTYPEFVVSGEYNFANGRVWLGGLLRNVQNDTGAGQHEENWGYQFAMAFNYRFTPRTGLGFFGTVGKGQNAFVQYNQQVINGGINDYSADTVFGYTLYAWVQHKLTDTIRVNLNVGYLFNDVADATDGGKAGIRPISTASATAPVVGVVHWVNSYHVNLIWSPVPQVDFGIEYMYAIMSRYNGPNSKLSRIQAAMLYRF